ncbi:hypothetical protein FS749_013352 [Ceratobasidium sp. UAMH 11750]|nr:hypothetical protein FS749_013352 [Ceratobasidium sp. UAMH 11750]
MSLEFQRTKVTIRKGSRLGSGAFGIVYHATETSTGRHVALKQSRVSRRIQRSLLQHEAAVLKFLSGHYVIPEVYAYGRIDHFELLSMQLLHNSLGDVVNKLGPMSIPDVLEVADQMLDALDYMHTRGLVHRDIKPSNILLQSPGCWRVCLIDFGLAYRPSRSAGIAELASSAPETPVGVFGTLLYASLNAHETRKLGYRDDLASLAYSLLWLLRGSLPWSHCSKHGTRLGRIRQVYKQKIRYNGLRLAAELPDEFGWLVDHARCLSADEIPDYAGWRKRLKKVCGTAPQFCPTPEDGQPPQAPTAPSVPVHAGQVVLVQLLPSITAEGCSIQAGHEGSYIRDARFDTLEWSAPWRPAIVTRVVWDERAGAYSFTAVAICRRNGTPGAAIVPISCTNPPNSEIPKMAVSVKPEWPFKDSFCYAYKRPTTFYCLPSQDFVPSTWAVGPTDVGILIKMLTLACNPDLLAIHQELESPDPDTRHDAKMRAGNVRLYAGLLPLTQACIEDKSVDWFSDRAWFDECVKASRYHDLDNGRDWSNALTRGSSHCSDDEISDSYTGSDFEEWSCQGERDKSITLGNSINGEDRSISNILDGIDEIVRLE